MSAQTVPYEIVDMYAAHPLAGSALGVVPDAEGLGDAQMAAIAAEIGTRETTFVVPPRHPEADYGVRVFTPEGESPFGGHSSAGTATTLVRRGVLPAGRLVQECGPKRIPLEAGPDRAVLRAESPLAGASLDTSPLPALLGLEPDDLAEAPALRCGFGPEFRYVPVRPAALERVRADPAAMTAAGIEDLFVLAVDGPGPIDTVEARLFAPGYGFPEDAACSSAVLGLAVWLARADRLPGHDGAYEFTVRQGHHMGRPSTLRGAAEIRDGQVQATTVAGAVLPAARGEIAAGALAA